MIWTTARASDSCSLESPDPSTRVCYEIRRAAGFPRRPNLDERQLGATGRSLTSDLLHVLSPSPFIRPELIP